jgi:hypothetical protein
MGSELAINDRRGSTGMSLEMARKHRVFAAELRAGMTLMANMI